MIPGTDLVLVMEPSGIIFGLVAIAIAVAAAWWSLREDERGDKQ